MSKTLKAAPETLESAPEPQMLSDYSRNIEYFCFKLQWTVDMLCEATGLSRNTINRIRANHHKHIDAHALTRFCNVFNVSPNELLLRIEGITY
jgi:DNA-binding Xre family transcriptional regulator